MSSPDGRGKIEAARGLNNSSNEAARGLKKPRKPFRVKGADGRTIEIKGGEYYFNPKARARRMMRDSLSCEARQVYACLELATMGFRQELAVIMEGGKTRPIVTSDIAKSTGLEESHVRRALRELEAEGLVERRPANGESLSKGNVLIYSWAEPRIVPQRANGNGSSRAPEWLPESWGLLYTFANRRRFTLPPDLRNPLILEQGAEVARGLEKAENEATRFLESVGALRRIYKEERKERKTEKKSEASSSSSVVVKAPKLTTTISEAETLADRLDTETDIARQLLERARSVNQTITLEDVDQIVCEKVNGLREKRRAGKVQNLPGLLIASMPDLARDYLRRRARSMGKSAGG